MTKDCSLHYSLCGPLQESLVFLESFAGEFWVHFFRIICGSRHLFQSRLIFFLKCVKLNLIGHVIFNIVRQTKLQKDKTSVVQEV